MISRGEGYSTNCFEHRGLPSRLVCFTESVGFGVSSGDRSLKGGEGVLSHADLFPMPLVSEGEYVVDEDGDVGRTPTRRQVVARPGDIAVLAA